MSAEHIKCPVPACPALFRNYAEMKTHINLVHITNKKIGKLYCPECLGRGVSCYFVGDNQLQRHRIRYHSTELNKSLLSEYNQRSMMESGMNKSSFYHHIMNAINEKDTASGSQSKAYNLRTEDLEKMVDRLYYILKKVRSKRASLLI